MSLTFLHGHVDLHIGGIDLRFPHHENERAQSNPLIEQGSNQEAVDLWLHGEHLLFEGRKMSKSAGNVVLLSDVVERGFDPLSVRFCLMENRYRSQMDLSWDSIAAADKVLDRWRSITAQAEGAKNLTPAMTSIRDEIVGYLAADLDSPRALQRLRSLEKESAIPLAEKAQLFASIDPLLGLDLTATPKSKEKKLSEEDAALLESRSKARDDRDFAESDRIRELLASRGIEVRDLPTGQEWHWI
jgi:cysteinyl-tRNA synthetase